MTKQFEAAVNVDVNIKDADKIKQSRQELNNLDTAAKQTKTGMDSATKSVNMFATATGGLKTTLNNVSGNFTKLSGDFQQIPGVIGYASQSVYGLVQAFNVLIANPVGIAIAAIAGSVYALFKAFQSTDEGGERINAFLAKLTAYLNVARDLTAKFANSLIEMVKQPKKSLQEFGEFIKQNIYNRIQGIVDIVPAWGRVFSKLFKGDFAGAAKEAADSAGKVVWGVNNITDKAAKASKAVSDLTAEMKRKGDIAQKLSRQLDALEDRERSLGVEREKQGKAIAAARLQSEDTTKSIEERIKALQRAEAAEQKLADKEAQIWKERAAIYRLQNKQTDESDEAKDRLAQAEAKVFQLQKDSFTKQRRLITTIQSLRNQDAAMAKADADAKLAAEKALQEKIKAQNDKALADELAYIENFYNLQKIAANQEITDEEARAEKLKQIEHDKNRDLLQAKKDVGIEDTALQLEQSQLELDIEKAKQDKLLQYAKEEEDRMIAVAELERQIYNDSVAIAQSVIDLVGRQTKVGKGIALAQVAYDTATALSGALANSNAPTPDNVLTGGLAGIAKYIGIAATIAVNAKKAKDIITGGNINAGGAAPLPSLNTSTQLQPRTFQASAIPEEGFNRDYKVYVLEGEITKTQKRVRDIESVSVVE